MINPCQEIDYGNHIFEDPNSHLLWGANATGRWHIRQLKLNAPHLVRERTTRTKLRLLWENPELQPLRATGDSFSAMADQLDTLRRIIEEGITQWPLKPAPAGYRFIP